MPLTSAQRSLAAAWALGTLAVLPALVAAFSGIGREWYPAGDWAMLELATRDVGTADTPLTGPYSRFSWNHPGALLFWIYAVPYRLTGGASWSMLVSAGLLNGACIGGMVALAWRRGRLPLVAITSVVLVLVAANLGIGFLRDPWNAWITALPLGLLVLLTWSATEGDRACLAWSALVGSFLVQSHVGFGLLVGVLWVVAAVGAWRFRVPVRSWLIAGGVLVVCWLPVVVEQVFVRGNLTDLLGHFAGDSESAGLGRAVDVVARQLGGVAPWMGGDEPADPVGGAIQPLTVGALLLPVVAFGVALGLAVWRRRFDAVRFQAVVGVASVVGLVSVARISGRIFDYLIRWWWLLAALWWVATLWSLWRVFFSSSGGREVAGGGGAPGVAGGAPGVAGRAPGVADRDREVAGGGGAGRRGREVAGGAPSVATWVLTVVALVFAGVLTTVTVAATPEHDTPAGDWYPTMEAITGPTVDAVRGLSEEGPVVLRAEGGLSGWVVDALGLQLEREGVDVAVEDVHINVHKWREHRLLGGRDAAALVWVAAGPPVREFDERAARDAEFTEVARWDPLDDEARSLRGAEEQVLFEQLEAADREDLVEAFRAGEGIRPAWELEGVDGELAERLDRTRGDAEQVVVYIERGPSL